uniref:SH3 domain-containing protein n=1 Tax=Syphacia muris TaxID=451379 RepID=A0A0N5AMA0_9BILA
MAFRKSTLVSLTKLATVRYSYHAAQDDELNLKVDDVIEVIEDAESGWMKGKLRSTGQVGLFPTNFVQFSGIALFFNCPTKFLFMIVDNSPEALQRPALTDNQKKRAAPIFNSSVGKKEMARVLYPYTPNHDDELALKEVGTMITVVKKTCSDPGWFLGEIDGKRGLIPDNFVEFIKVPATSSEEKKTSAPAVCYRIVNGLLKYEEGPADTRVDGPLEHITTSRPKQPNKRPPSTIFNKRVRICKLLDLANVLLLKENLYVYIYKK